MKENEIITLGMLPTITGKIHQQSRILDVGGVSPTLTARDYKDPHRILLEVKPKTISL